MSRGKVGLYGPASDSTLHDEKRLGRTLAQITQDAHGRYHEAASRGNLYHASMQAGAALGTALTSTAVTLTLYNPADSGVVLSIVEIAAAITTMLAAPGAPGAATAAIVAAGNVNRQAAAPSAVTEAVVRCSLLGNSAGAGKAYTAATLPANPVVIAPLFNISYSEITAAAIAQFAGRFIAEIDGKLCLQPNTAVTIQSIGAAISGIISMMWEEIPLLPAA